MNEQRFNQRCLRNEQDLNDANLEGLARAMSMGASSANVKSCYMSIRTPQTMKSGSKSQVSRMTGMSNTITQNWYANRSLKGPTSMTQSTNKIPRLKQNFDIYSNFSKKTTSTYQSLQAKTVTRLQQTQQDQKSEILSKLSKNEFMPKETLSQFIEKQTNPRGKKLFFAKQPGPEQKRQLLDEYLQIVKAREEERQRQRK